MYRLFSAFAVLVITSQTGALAQEPPDQEKPKKSVWRRVVQSPNQPPVQNSGSVVEAATRRVETRALSQRSINGSDELIVRSEEQTERLDASTVKTTRRLYGRDQQGGDKIIEIIEEIQRTDPNGAVRVESTTHNPDLNGRFQPTRRELYEAIPVQDDLVKSKTTTLEPGINGGFVAIQEIHQTERTKPDGITEVESTRLVPTTNQGWQTSERRLKIVQEITPNQKTEEEQVFRRDLNERMSLSQRTISRSWKEAGGAEHQTIESYGRTFGSGHEAGRDGLHLEERVRTVRTALPDGSVQTVEEVERRNQAELGAGLMLVERAVERLRPDGSGGKEGERIVQSPDVNGNLTTVRTEQIKEPKP